MGTQNRGFGEARDIKYLEQERQELQKRIDNQKSVDERRKFGQFSTPISLAEEIASYGLSIQQNTKISFLEPAIGTGAFLSALLSEIEKTDKNILSASGIEIDKEFFEAASLLWKDTKLNLLNTDFTSISPNSKYNFVISNPPYVRHHYISQCDKIRLSESVKKETQLEISGLSGLYCYFVLLAHKWLSPNAICGWLLPSEFMDVNYGDTLKAYLLDKVHLLRIHRYDPKQCKFDDALVSSCVVWFKNETVDNDYEIEFSFGGTHLEPILTKQVRKSILKKERKWTQFPIYNFHQSSEKKDCFTLGDFFDIKRGLATGDNAFFILTKEQIHDRDIEMSFFSPILPSPRYLDVDEVLADEYGYPQISTQYFLLNCTLPENEIKESHPQLWSYLETGSQTTALKYLCKSRKEWYLQEKRKTAKFLCSYMGRGGKKNALPFRFILNHSEAVATNSYLMLYPKRHLSQIIEANPDIINDVWEALKDISAFDFEKEGRTYGGGLKKIEPKELEKVQCQQLSSLYYKFA